MITVKISLLGSLKDFVGEQMNKRGYGTSSEYVSFLSRRASI